MPKKHKNLHLNYRYTICYLSIFILRQDRIEAEDEAVNEQRVAFEENMSKKENQMKELDRVSKSLSEELKNLHLEVKVKRDSEDQMKQVLKEYEKTISELVAEKEREKLTSEEERLRLIAERDQAVEDLRVSKRVFFNFFYELCNYLPFLQ